MGHQVPDVLEQMRLCPVGHGERVVEVAEEDDGCTNGYLVR